MHARTRELSSAAIDRVRALALRRARVGARARSACCFRAPFLSLIRSPTRPPAGYLIYVNGERYEGYWKNDRAHGKGTLTYSQGDRYVGDWVAGKKHGQGELQYANGDVFRGEWNDDHATGRGILSYSNGNVYEGGWLMDRRHGFGIFTCAADGYRYEGEWYQGRRHGTGTIYLPNGDSFSGQFKEGRAAGPVEYRFADDSPWSNADL